MPHPSESIPNFAAVKRAIGQRHLEQLRDLNLVEDPLERNLPVYANFDDIWQWTIDSKSQIATGKANRVYGGRIGSPINFNNAFMAFLESAAMYLRDTSKIVRAAKAYRLDSKLNLENALDLLESSTTEIDKLADMWGMHFIQICDFVTRHPDGHQDLVGPFCGAFVPKDFGNSPFIGVSFKGTSMSAEIINDLRAMSTLYASGRLWESQVSKGFYYPVFSTYNGSNMPFALIQKAVQYIAIQGKTTAVTHVTGHSLGGAYASLCYAQLCIEGFGTSQATLGDLYTFGSPRVGRGDFAKPLKAAVSPPADQGSAWRIVNNRDYVPKVPASLPWSSDPFIHVDSAYKIYPDRGPMAQPSEIGTRPTWSVPTAISPHYTTEYYRSLTYATTKEAPAHAVVSRGRYLLAVSTFSGPIDTSLPLNDVASPVITVESIQDYTVGTIRLYNFLAEFTAYGVIQAKLNCNPRLHYNKSLSLRSLYAKENQCIFSKEDDSTLKISFIVDGTQTALAYVSTASGDIDEVELTRGSCAWTFYEDMAVDEVEASIIKSADKIFSIPDGTEDKHAM